MIVAVDGPLASGKGTIARALAARLGFHYLDTGLLYRAVGLEALDQGADPGAEPTALAAAKALKPDRLADPRLRSLAVAAAASKAAAIPAVRDALLDFQRQFATRPPGAVLDGRDIGTIVCPEAEVKIFVTASEAVRAQRRQAELAKLGDATEYETVLAALRERDRRDRERAAAPLRPAADAHLLDTSDLTIDGAIEAAHCLVAKALASRAAPSGGPESLI